MGDKLKPIGKALLKFGVTGIALYFVFKKISFSDILDLYRQSNLIFLLFALLFFIISKVISAYRLNLFFHKAGLRLDKMINLRLYLLGMFYNLFLPGGIGGDGYKIYLLQKRYKTGTGKLFGAVLSDRLSGMMALFMLAVIFIPFLELPVSYHHFAFLLAPVAALAFYLFLKWVYPWFTKIFLITTGYSFVVQILQVVSAWFIFLALGADQGLLAYMVLFLVSSIVAVLPFTIGGVGAREITFLYGSQLLNVDMQIAVGLSLMFYVITAVVSFCGIYFVVKGIIFKGDTDIH